MIVQAFVVLLILSVASIYGVTGASYSNVHVESKVAPLEYYTYGAPYQSIANPRLSEINSLPSIPGYVAPCVSPCVYPAQTVANVASLNPSQNVLTYNAPSVPIVVAPNKQDATGYEYSYVVYDENTGDHKAQRELSDGAVVRGEYSLLQPDGFVRQVQYVADDISGFNAVVKQYLPTAGEGHRKAEGPGNKESSPPCHETKNESLKEKSDEDSGEMLLKNHGKSKESREEENSKESHEKVSKEETGEDSKAESHENQLKEAKHSKETPEEESQESSQDKTLHKQSKSSGESKEKHTSESEKETDAEESKEELKEKSPKKSPKGSDEPREKDIKDSDEESGKETDVDHGKHNEVYGLLNPNQEAVVSYNDITRCIEAAMRRNYGVPAAMRQAPSPLTYIVLNRPC